MNGMVEYWQPEAPFELPRSLKFEMKSETDLYEFRKVGQNDFCMQLCILIWMLMLLEQIGANFNNILARWSSVCDYELP